MASSCTDAPRKATQSRSITVLMWISGPTRAADRELVSEFTQKTGIAVQLIPAPESSWQRLKEELNNSPAGLDVVEFDLAWTPQLTTQLADLSRSLGDRMSEELPEPVSGVTIGSSIIGAPFFSDYGLLYYRTDLLRKYGYTHPPATWTELETQARTIQAGERTAGHRNFWGYVWQGAAYEGLTCNALEWQYSQGGGNFVTPDRKSNVANRNAVQAFSRAARWIGTISPPGVLAYTEEDSRNVWQSGNAAFLRNWGYAYALAKTDPHIADHFAVSVLPAGSNLHSSVIGGWYLGIPRSSRHQANAIAFIRFMTSRRVQVHRALTEGYWPTLKEAYDDPQLKDSHIFEIASEAAKRAIHRPITVVGSLYPCVSDIYARHVHNILSRKTTARLGTQRTQEEISSVLQSDGKQGCL